MTGKSGFFERNLKYLFPLPAFILVFLVMIFPMGHTLFMSFTDWSLMFVRPDRFVGLQNYITILGYPRFQMALIQTLVFTFGAVITQTILGTIIALVLHREFKGKSLFKLMLLLPLAATPVAIGIVFRMFFDPSSGFLNFVLGSLGLPQSGWITDAGTVLPSLILVDTWQWTPMIALIVLVGLSGLPREPFESAKVDGANPVQTFFCITLPMLMPTIISAVVLRSVGALKTYDLIAAMTSGGPGFASETLNFLAFQFSFVYIFPGQSSAMLVIFFLIILFCSILIMQLRKKFEA